MGKGYFGECVSVWFPPPSVKAGAMLISVKIILKPSKST